MVNQWIDLTIKQLHVDAIEALNLNIFISVCLRSESHIAHHEFPSTDGKQRRGLLMEISTLYRMERVEVL